MSKIYTKTGDDGTTGLFGSNNVRIKKYDLRTIAYGTVDELNVSISYIRTNLPKLKDVSIIINDKLLTIIQKKLYNISSQLAMDRSKISYAKRDELLINPDDIKLLESSIDFMTSVLPELKDFILPSGHIAAIDCHHSRTICRRCERHIIKLRDGEAIPYGLDIDDNVLIYINRLSDFLFVLARYINLITNTTEEFWHK